jgi:hypothetical protein
MAWSDSKILVLRNSEKHLLLNGNRFTIAPLPLFMTNFLLSSDAEKSARVFLLAIHIPLYQRILPPSPPPMSINGLKLVCNLNIVYGNLKSENSRDCTLMNSASG